MIVLLAIISIIDVFSLQSTKGDFKLASEKGFWYNLLTNFKL